MSVALPTDNRSSTMVSVPGNAIQEQLGGTAHVQGDLFHLPGHEKKGDPILKWPGGKRGLIKKILPLIPQSFRRYYEPFLGGGALFFWLQPRSGVLADKNQDLINCYVQIRDNPAAVVYCLSKMENSEEEYYRVRASEPKDEIERAARTYYLALLSFNGIHRVNLQGRFNVPYSHKVHLNPCNPSQIYAASDALKPMNLVCEDFEETVRSASAGDLIYIDPPYTVAHGNNGFIKYNAHIFSWSDQERLAKIARELKERGCSVILSNADHESIAKLYEGFAVTRVSRFSTISAKGAYRSDVTECIFHT